MGSTLDDLTRQVEHHVKVLEFLSTFELDDWDEISDEDKDGLDLEDVLSEDGTLSLYDYCTSQLDIAVYGQRIAGEWSVTHVEVLFTCGGPDVRFTTEESSYVIGRWGSDVVRRYVGCDVAAKLDEWFGSD